MGLWIRSVLETKRDGGTLASTDIVRFIDGLVSGIVSRPQAAAFLSAVFIHGMTAEETVALTLAMRDSGVVLSWPGQTGPFVDKHSTGGVGDKVSLVLAPLWAELGRKVPMISGRGLGHTGGTLDKLESIPGFSTDLPTTRLREILADVGCFICGQTSDLAPADRILYALRNETCTVPSIPLITASILSKKLAEGIDELVMDVKWGSGAFMKRYEDAEALAASLKAVGEGAGVSTRVVLSDMNQPLGEAVGNALEVAEAIRCLRGEGPADLAELVCTLIGDPRAAAVLASGAAHDRFVRMVEAQGGDLSVPLHGGGCAVEPLLAARDGIITRCDALEIGQAAFALGAGRARAEQDIHPGVGLRIHRKVGDTVQAGEPLVTIAHAGVGLEDARSLLSGAVLVGEG